MKRILAITTLVLLCSVSNIVAAKTENRIIMDEDFLWVTPQQADAFVERSKKAGFNILIPCVWHGRGVSWISRLAPREPRWEREKLPATHDPLAYLIRKARQAGMEVHPWFTLSLRQRDFFQQYYDEKKSPNASFDIHRPEFQDFMVNLIAEVVRKYDIQGINLDYVRTRGTCTCPRCVKDYAAATGRDLVSDAITHKVSPPAQQALIRWHSSAVDNFVKRLAQNLRQLKKDLVISCDSHPGRQGFFIEGADSITWANNGWCDFVLSMDYGAKLNATEFELAKSRVVNVSKIVLIVGNYEKKVSPDAPVTSRRAELVRDLVSASQTLHQKHVATGVYCYKLLDDAQIRQLGETVYKLPLQPSWTPLPR